MIMKEPNILITGTPGVGKSRLSSEISSKFKLKWHDVSAIAKEKGFVENHDDEYECPIINEDKLMDYLEPIMQSGGNIVEYHGCDFFPKRWFDVVFVIRCNNTILFDRLSERGYNEKKLQSNIECEIFQIILEEAQESYDHNIVHELKGESENDLKENINRIGEWIDAWKNDHK